MKIAVTYENGEIFGHFGHTKQFKVFVDTTDDSIEQTLIAKYTYSNK